MVLGEGAGGRRQRQKATGRREGDEPCFGGLRDLRGFVRIGGLPFYREKCCWVVGLLGCAVCGVRCAVCGGGGLFSYKVGKVDGGRGSDFEF